MGGTVGMMRTVVLLRDKRCMAPVLDPKGAGCCYDAWGNLLPLGSAYVGLEADYIEVGASGPRHVLASDHVALCAGHHRGTGPQRGVVWRKQKGHRELLRKYLTEVADGEG